MSHDQPLKYIPRIRDYYLALGYAKPYQWAHYEDVPLTKLNVPLADATIGLITTAAPHQDDKGAQGPGAPYNGAAKFYSIYSLSTALEPELFISHIAYDRDHTTAADQGTYFPLQALNQLVAEGVIGAVAPRFHGLPTNRSQRTTITVDCPELIARCRADNIDGAILVPNCPVCHQSAALAARALEAAGIATVIMGCARDITEHIGVPRLLFSNFPLGNSAGLPGDRTTQHQIAAMAVKLLETADTPRTTRTTPFGWSGNPNWQQSYSNAALLEPAELRRRREEFDRNKRRAKSQPNS
jgi:hypothetical protein